MNDKRTVFTDALETLGTLIDEHQKRDAIHLAVEPVIAGEGLEVGYPIGLGKDGLAYDDLCKCKKYLGIVDPFLEHYVERGERFWMIIFPRQITSLRHVWEHPDIPNYTFEHVASDIYISDIYSLIDNYVKEFRENRKKFGTTNSGASKYLAGGSALLGGPSIVFTDTPEYNNSLKWLQNYASSLGNYTSDDLIEAAKNFIENDEYYLGNSKDYAFYYEDFYRIETNPEFWRHFQIITGIIVPQKKQTNFFSCSC